VSQAAYPSQDCIDGTATLSHALPWVENPGTSLRSVSLNRSGELQPQAQTEKIEMN
jgi:hypothetical protein